MPVPHFNIKITQRSKGKSAVAGAAYQAGEKLFSEYDQKTKNYTCKKEVVYTEIMLPPNAPPEYADRAALWNSVEEIEKQWNSQLARRFVAALPREVPMELLPQMVKEYCEEHFVSKGMCCDFAIHDPDPPGHNAVKQNVTTRQAAELYGIRVGRNGMAVCPFHNDKNPSMKLDRRFHCFGCQADGDAVDFVSRLFGLPSKEAAMKIADDFGISYDSRQKPSIRPKIREPTPEQKYQQEENHCYKVLSDYFHLLRKWEKQYAPQRTDEVWHPLFVEALQKKSYIEYLLDILLYDTPEEKKALVAEQRKEVMKLEQRIAGHTAEHDRGRSQRKSGLDR